ncbi:DUF3489 domain-containing protein [Ruegeria pomeroyi]|uniref:DUF3489 domain-containing protein n=1 Tax=Ruegeria alba TaxID=2916756 RepID=A0ABS9P2A2_9RHOB|nr:DUF3489 domain-containing protein [Ruegeria alba]MCE8514888.1 DUF3489 domain-containing protein [Ruegeria pomeroyi]MCE8527581.1 DUF3489 domain-containing protein [Ruegeria pomeroyi]MCE8531720.1 DUF3489 domain-containing protein [Ruegeria pomeroyi]MCG6560610.1 DUF3489 domain-containing protein [Ruegeria alba]
MSNLTDTQSIILSRAAARPGNLALPLPDGLHGAAARTVVGKMMSRGWLEEVDANLRQGEPLWRETGDGHGTTLITTEAGLATIGIEPVVAGAAARARKAKVETGAASEVSDASNPIVVRAGTKQAQIIAMLQRPEGATITEIVAATSWQVHSVRGMISGALKKKLGLPITAEKVEGRATVYRIDLVSIPSTN